MSAEFGLTEAELRQNTFIYDLMVPTDLNGWLTRDGQWRNFTALSRIADFCERPLVGSSVLDVGCANGDLVPFLRERGVDMDRYLGLDIHELTLELARQRYPDARFERCDLLMQPLEEQFDFSIASGSLYGNMLDHDNYDFLERMLRRIWESTRFGMSFNFLRHIPQIQEENFYIFFYQSGRVREICDRLPGIDRVIMESRDEELEPGIMEYKDDVFVVRSQ